MQDANEQYSQEPVLFRSRIFKITERTCVGRSGRTLRRHIVVHPGAVGIVPILQDGRVGLIKQFRVAIQKEIYEIPAGTREEGEAPLATAARELAEEIGGHCAELVPLGSIFTSPGVLQEELFLFLARDVALGESAPEDGELIELAPKTWQEIDEMLDSHVICDGKTIAGLCLARRKLGLDR